MHTISRRKYYLILLLVTCTFSAKAQNAYQKYNESMRITEYYNADSVMTKFSRYNKRSNTIDFYSAKGVKLRSEHAIMDSTKIVSPKKAYPKAQLTQQELDNVQAYRYHKIGEQTLIQEEHPDLEHIGYYDLEGKLVAMKHYNRGTETWELNILSSDKE